MNLKFDTILPSLGVFPEKYEPAGYFDDIKVDRKLEIMSKAGFTGLGMAYPIDDDLPSDPDSLIKKLHNNNLVISTVMARTWRDRKWKHGAFAVSNRNRRNEAVKLFKEAIDFARAANADNVLLWSAHDGFDYPFQADYKTSWENFIETVKEIGAHDARVKIAIEYKLKEPRQKFFISNIGKLMILLNEVGLENVGGVLDIGHSYQAQENASESLIILEKYKKLFQVHLNDNYKDADSDMLFGSINFFENLEFFYYLLKTDYNSWLSFDIISPRIDRIRSLELSIKAAIKYKVLAEKLLEHSKTIDTNLKNYNFADNMELILDLLK